VRRELAAAVVALRDDLSDEQRAAACLPFGDDGERRNWFYWPGDRAGLALADMTARQRKLAHAAIATLLSLPAYAKVTTIIALEEVLGELEGHSARRDSSHYYTTVFGEPEGNEPWGWRFEGHHVSLHVTVAGDDIVSTPLFLGANPNEVRHGDRTVIRPLGEEEDVARALLDALPAAQRRDALVDDTAPDDIVTRNDPRVLTDFGDTGVPLADLSGDAAVLADVLLDLYADRLAVAPELARPDVRFAWAGSPERGRPHYYRLAGSRVLIEWDNTQDGANHAHSVLRDPRDDFGEDMLRRHRKGHHGSRG
jgi:hypothetical protein